MAETRTLTDHDEIRDWAAARAGKPVISDPAPGMDEGRPVLRIAFGQHAYRDTDEGADHIGGNQIVEWDDWFEEFEKRELALVVSVDVPGQRDEFHEIIRR